MKTFLIVVIIILSIIIAGTFAIHIKRFLDVESNSINDVFQHIENNNELEKEKQEEIIEEKKVQIFYGNSRPIAVMIDNVGDARPQAGLNEAYMVYEIIVEGGLTRLMALYKGAQIDKIGPIRSSRHYFLDYALENDAIYVHFGWSPRAKNDITSLKVDNINGIYESSTSFWRVSDKSAPHNVVTSTDKILDMVARKGYRTTSEQESVLNYVTEEVELKQGIDAEEITIPYTSSYKVIYKYNEETKRYTRGYNKTTQKDWDTNELITTKNIIITFAENTDLNDGSGKDRQDLKNIGLLDGYYITNGKAIQIKCQKSSRTSKTIYRDLKGNKINVNDGNTFVQIVPIDVNVEIEPGENRDININNENAIN